MRILLDMDEVLCNFRDAAKRLHGNPTDEQMADKYGSWWDGNSFWKPIRAEGVMFWAWLEPYEWMNDLITLVKSYDPEFHIVSAGQPYYAPQSYEGKTVWISRYLGHTFDRFTFTKHKEKLALPGTVLIDDSIQNCSKFIAAGGYAIPFQFGSEPATVEYVMQYVSHRLKGIK